MTLKDQKRTRNMKQFATTFQQKRQKKKKKRERDKMSPENAKLCM